MTSFGQGLAFCFVHEKPGQSILETPTRLYLKTPSPGVHGGQGALLFTPVPSNAHRAWQGAHVCISREKAG